MKSRILASTSPLRSTFLAAWLLVAGAALVAPAAAVAAASPAEVATPAAPVDVPKIRPLVGVLLTGTLTSDAANLTNPDGSSVYGHLGGRIDGFAGAEFPLAANGLALRLTVGMQTTSVSSPSGSERFTRFPLEASVMYPLSNQLRVGAGARYAARIRFSGAGGDTSDGLNATPGMVFLADYLVVPHLSLDLRYVYERFEQAKGGDVDGSHFGIGATAIY